MSTGQSMMFKIAWQYLPKTDETYKIFQDTLCRHGFIHDEFWTVKILASFHHLGLNVGKWGFNERLMLCYGPILLYFIPGSLGLQLSWPLMQELSLAGNCLILLWQGCIKILFQCACGSGTLVWSNPGMPSLHHISSQLEHNTDETRSVPTPVIYL